MVSFSDGLDDFIWRLRVEAAPRVLRAARPMIELGSGTGAAQGLPPEEGALTLILAQKIVPLNPSPASLW